MIFTIITVFIALYFPLSQYFFFAKKREQMTNNSRIKIKFYKETSFFLWLMALLLFLILVIEEIERSLLGLLFEPDLVFWILSGISLAVAFFLFRSADINEKNYEDIEKAYGHVRFILPDNDREYKWSVITGITAGITEEFIFRAYLFWYFNQYMDWYLSILVLNIIFSFCHTWSGLKNMFGAFNYGIVMSLAYYFSGSIYLSIFLHALADLYSSVLGRNLSRYEKEISDDN